MVPQKNSKGNDLAMVILLYDIGHIALLYDTNIVRVYFF